MIINITMEIWILTLFFEEKNTLNFEKKIFIIKEIK